jgi:hypothetical protein
MSDVEGEEETIVLKVMVSLKKGWLSGGDGGA